LQQDYDLFDVHDIKEYSCRRKGFTRVESGIDIVGSPSRLPAQIPYNIRETGSNYGGGFLQRQVQVWIVVGRAWPGRAYPETLI
jgi:hypothetical protein